MEISLTDARKIILNQQLLSGFKGSPMAAIKHLGYLQIDTICVIERAHNHILWSRSPKFKPEHLENLHRKKGVFEYWAHAMSYLPVSDYRFSLPIMKHFHERKDCQEILSANRILVEEVRNRIKAEGPLSASDFATPEEFKGKGGWWQRKPAKQVLEVLYWRGELSISHRENFKRFYDFTDRVLTLGELDRTVPDADETLRHHLTRVLRTMGVAGKADLLWFVKDKKTAMRVLKEMIGAREVSELKIEKLGDTYYVLGNVLNDSSSLPSRQGVKILSPFDNMIIRRDFIKRFFNFDYVFECYVPQAKRRFGYFSCPILAGTNIIGTIDGKADRPNREFVIKNLHLSAKPGSLSKKYPLEALSNQIRDFAIFNGCDTIRVECRKKQTNRVEELLTNLKQGISRP